MNKIQKESMNRKLKILLFSSLILSILYLFYFYKDYDYVININPKLKSTIIFIIFYLSVNLVSNIVKYFYSKAHNIPENKKNNVHFGIENIAKVTISVGLFFLMLSLLGVNPIELVTSLTIVAAAFAILTKEYIADFISGIYLSFSNTFEINDFVKIDDQKGKIVEITMMKIKILNDDDDIVVLPNAKVYNNEIINYTRRDARLMTIDFQIATKNIKSVYDLENIMIQSVEEYHQYIEPNSYNLRLVNLKHDHLDLKFQYTLKFVDRDLQKKIRRKIIRSVFEYTNN
jgi:MscS family membrane protein